jgi:hypothetical protein
MTKARIETVAAAIEALGGSSEIRRIAGVSPQVVWNWKDRNRFSARKHAMLSRAFRKRGLYVDEKLWGQA